ncbi:MAG: hypothetical protein QM714_00885 [Nocardioides sp.]|uniref:hypothetical protein n=1 Tax=Nocardioides sp. TaxID=35761 RepID=UPI0039E4E459
MLHRVRRPWAVMVVVAVTGLAVTTALTAGDRIGAHPSVSAPSATGPASVDSGSTSPTGTADPSTGPTLGPSLEPVTESPPPKPALLPGGRHRVFGGNRFLVAYYGTAGTGALGVLGETDPDTATRRLARAAAPFRRPGQPIQLVYELIVTVADAYPGKDGSYSHDIARDQVRRYIRAAHRHGALVVLDLQPGRSHFLAVAKRWEWALRDPWVGLALDPEWRMGPHQVPARVIGSVSAREINRTTAWLAALTRRERLPQKLLLLHQFRTSMIRDIGDLRTHPELAMVQHVDGFGTQGQKLDTYHAVLRPHLLIPGFKLFYDEDIHRMGPVAVHAIRPKVRFVSFQ